MRRAAVIVVIAACGQDARIPSEGADQAAVPIFVGTSRPHAAANEAFISSSEFDMGPTEAINDPQVILMRQHARLSAFYIDRDPVTNGQYRACVDAGACPPDCKTKHVCTGAMYDEIDAADKDAASYPLATATWDGARAYCSWAGKRLPTEEEWERAARGASLSTARELTLVQTSNDGDRPARWSKAWLPRVGLPTADATDEGVRNMLTGVPELVSRADSTFRAQVPVVRGNLSWGGRVSTTFTRLGMSYPYPAWARDEGTYGGFRCARSEDPNGISPTFFSERQHLLGGREVVR